MRPRRLSASTAALAATLILGGCGRQEPAASNAPSAPRDPASAPADAPVTTEAPPDGPCVAVRDDEEPDTESYPVCPRTGGSTRLLRGTLVDARGDPAPNVALRFWQPDHATNRPTDVNGAFEVALYPRESYDVDAFLGASGWSLECGRRVHVGTIRPGAVDARLRVPEVPAVLASGVLVDGHRAPLPGWDLSVSRVDGAGDEKYLGAVTTDDLGRYRVVAWRGGTIRMNGVRGPEGESWRVAGTSIDSEAGVTLLTARPAISGKVVVDDGGTAAGAIVRLWRAAGILDRVVIVDASGAFDFDNTVPGGAYEIGVEHTGYEPRERRDCGYDDLYVRIDLVGPHQRIGGRLLDGADEPVACTWIRLVPADGRRPLHAMTGVDGAFGTVEARDVEFEAFALVTGTDGRLVPGPHLGRCRGGERSVVLRSPR